MYTRVYIARSTTSSSRRIIFPIALTPTGAFPLVSRGKNTSGSNQCYGTDDGTGNGYINTCIHSGTVAEIDINTTWYNYAMASAGSITGASNTVIAVQSICPKSWTLPSKEQLDSINGSMYVSNFSPIRGGYYQNASLSSATQGSWWSSEAFNNVLRRRLYYVGGLNTGTGFRRSAGVPVRCIQSS